MRLSKLVYFFNTISPNTLSCLASTACKRISSKMARKAHTSAPRDRKLRRRCFRRIGLSSSDKRRRTIINHLRNGDIVFFHFK